MPGLLRGVARTAAVVGTAQATRGRVARRQQQRWARQDQAAAPPVYAAPPPAAPPAPAAPAPPAQRDPIELLERLAALKAQGILTEEEFAAQKAKILAG